MNKFFASLLLLTRASCSSAQRSLASGPTITTDKSEYSGWETIEVTIENYDNPTSSDWVGIWPAVHDPQALPSPSTMWDWLTSNTVTFEEPLCDGEYEVYLLQDISPPYQSLAAAAFTVSGSTNEDCTSGVCTLATSPYDQNVHLAPVDGTTVSNIAFSSCYAPSYQISNALWKHMRNTFQADLWLWLGDNSYSDGRSLETKRERYNAARNDQYYRKHGPVAEPKIPVTGTWDDHDYAANNQGDEYECKKLSQDEFVYHFNIPSDDPRHPDQGENQREGIYSAYMFSKPDGGNNGIHQINLDARYHRNPTFDYYGTCQGADTDMLGETQWAWLEQELSKPSEIKVIATGIQVLPPLNRGRDLSDYCAYDGNGNSFDTAIADVGESDVGSGTSYEAWAEIPTSRTRLLKLCQKSINDGNAKEIVFVSGDQHWAEIQAKKMPFDENAGAEQILYEVTASGIDQQWNVDVDNPNRVRVRSADSQGSGDFVNECNFPFQYDGTVYNDCTTVGHDKPWCSIETTSNDVHIPGSWGNCLPEEEELVPRSMQSYGKSRKCTDQYHHTCTAQANYGGIEVDWSSNRMKLAVYTPHHEGEVEASSILVDFSGAPANPTPAPSCEDLDTFEDSKGKTRECSWVAQQKKKRCKKFSDFCPVTCETCQTEPPQVNPTPSPVSSPTATPAPVDPTPTPSCEDTDTFEVKGKTRECSWVASKKEKRCKKFSDYCPVTCETCPAPAPVPSPMASPVPVDPTQAPNCEDLDTFEDSKGKTRTCSWVGKKEKQRCKKFSDFCPVTCDVCETISL